MDRRTISRAIINRRVELPDKWVADVDSVSPLRIRVRGTLVDATPDTLVADLAVNESVWGETVGGRAVILGRFGGTPLATADGPSLIVLASGMTLVHCTLARVGRHAQLALRVQSDTDIPAGNHTNMPVGTLVAGWRPAIQTPLSAATAGSSLGALGTDGTVEITATIATTPAGSSIDLYGTFLIGA